MLNSRFKNFRGSSLAEVSVKPEREAELREEDKHQLEKGAGGAPASQPAAWGRRATTMPALSSVEHAHEKYTAGSVKPIKLGQSVLSVHLPREQRIQLTLS